jgi:hypothetical protein
MNRAERRAQARRHDNASATARKHAAPRRIAHYINQPSLLLLAYGQPDFTPAEVVALVTAKRLAFERIRSGAAVDVPGHADADAMAELVNILIVLSERITDASARCEVEAVGHAAAVAVMAAKARAAAGQSFGFDGLGIHAIVDALDMFEQLLPLSKPAHLAQAMATMLQRMTSGHVYTTL